MIINVYKVCRDKEAEKHENMVIFTRTGLIR